MTCDEARGLADGNSISFRERVTCFAIASPRFPCCLPRPHVAFAPPPHAQAGEQRISGPYTHDNLTIFLVHGASSQGPVPLTLDEALEKGGVKVHETGTVGELEIENAGDEDVFVNAGDIVKGGQQDRVVTRHPDPQGASRAACRFPCSASRAGAGRRAATRTQGDFASAKEMLPTREAKLAMRSPYTIAAAARLLGASADGQRISRARERDRAGAVGRARAAEAR